MADHHEHHQHGHDLRHAHQPGSGGRLGLVIGLNAVITVAEYVGGTMAGSLALVADAGHNLSDVLSLTLGWLGVKVSARRPDRTYTFGLKRFEVLVALVNALSLMAIGVYLVREALERYAAPVPVDPRIMLPVAALGLAVNLSSMALLLRQRDESLNIRAAVLHLLYDSLSSVAVIAAGVVLLVTGNVLIDLVMTGIIAVMIFWSSLGIVRESARIFLQGTPGHIDTDDIYEHLRGVPGVTGVHGLHVWSISSTEVFLSCHICLAAGEDAPASDTVIKTINAMLEEHFDIRHTTIQVEQSMLCDSTSGECCR